MEDFAIRIFCEGISDQRFLRDFLKVHYNIDVSDKELKSNIFIQNLGSWNKLQFQKQKITETYSDYTSLIFLDADNEKVLDKLGFDKTVISVRNLMTEWNWQKFDILFYQTIKIAELLKIY